MPSLLSVFINVCLPLLGLIALGWCLDRKFRFDLRTLVKLNIYVFVPAFILVKLSTSTIPGKTGALVMIFTICVIASMAAISWLVARLRGDPSHDRAGLQLSTMIYNSGNWGLPLLSLAFPGEGGVVQMFVLVTMNLSNFTVGVFLANASDGSKAGNNWQHMRAIFLQPSIYAICIAFVLRMFDNPLQEILFLWQPFTYLADGLIGFALFTLGVQLSQTKPPKPVGRLGWALGIRLIGGPLVAILLTWLFGFSGTFAAILIVGAASPTAVNTALLAHELGADSRFAAAAVYYSTLFAALVVAVLLAILNQGGIPWAVPGGT